jgi:hypothetical protein
MSQRLRACDFSETSKNFTPKGNGDEPHSPTVSEDFQTNNIEPMSISVKKPP